MSTILESVNTLSEKLGVTEREQTIKDQLDLCVERLGGEGNSKDIAESAEKFAEKEDGTATFMTKAITENNTYNAADDGVSGYSSVTVNVANSYTADDNGKVVSEQELVAQTAYPTTVTQNDTYDTTNYNSITVTVESEPHFNTVLVSTPKRTADGASLDFELELTRITYASDGLYIGDKSPDTDSSTMYALLATRAKKINIDRMLPGTYLIFNPDNSFEGFFCGDTPVTPTGDSIGYNSMNDTYMGYVTGSQAWGEEIYLVKKTSFQFPFSCTIE